MPSIPAVAYVSALFREVQLSELPSFERHTPIVWTLVDRARGAFDDDETVEGLQPASCVLSLFQASRTVVNPHTWQPCWAYCGLLTNPLPGRDSIVVRSEFTFSVRFGLTLKSRTIRSMFSGLPRSKGSRLLSSARVSTGSEPRKVI